MSRLKGSAEATVGQGSAALAAVLFGSGYVATAFALRSLSPWATAMWRGIGATAVLTLVILAAQPRGPIRMEASRFWRFVVLGLSGGLVFLVAMNAAVALSGATLAAFAASLSPIVAAMLAPWVLGEPLNARVVAAFAGATGGTALLTQASAGGFDVRGLACGLLAAASFAVFLLLSRRWSTRYRLTGNGIALSIAGTTALGLLPVELLLEPGALIPSVIRPEALAGMLWLTLVSGVAAQLLVVAGVRRVETRLSAAYLLLSPVSAAVLAALLLGESLSSWQQIGALVILISVVMAAALRPQRRSRHRQLQGR